jgi:hypothetical protein
MKLTIHTLVGEVHAIQGNPNPVSVEIGIILLTP